GQHRDRRQHGERRCRAAPSANQSDERRGGGSKDRGEQQGGHQSRSSRSWSRSAPPKVRRSRPVSTPMTITANSTSSEAPSSTINGTPAVSRNAMAAIPLSSMRNPAACDTA